MTIPIIMQECGFGSLKTVVAIISIYSLLSISLMIQYPLFATLGSSQLQGEKSDINAATVYDTHSMILGNNIKNLVILIPNEAHESPNQPKNQLPLANQPYLPQDAVVNQGTTVTWFNGDVDHDHKITISLMDLLTQVLRVEISYTILHQSQSHLTIQVHIILLRQILMITIPVLL